MKFSIIIPVYNAEKYISTTLEHTLKLNNDCYEIVLVDDGSTDSSPRLCDQFAENYPEKIRVIHQKNQGQLAARCNGIKAAGGDYCLFLDADDLLIDNVLSDLNRIILENNCPDMVMFSFYYDRNGMLEISKLFATEETVFEGSDIHLLQLAFFKGTVLNSVCTKVVKREVALKSTEGYENYMQLRCAEDRYQSMKMLCNVQRVVYTPKPYYRYRLVDGSTTRQFSKDAISRFNTRILYCAELEVIKEWGMDYEEWVERLQASWASYTIYVMDMFYNNVMSTDRQDVLRYPWSEFLPQCVSVQQLQVNPYLGNTQKCMWKWIENEDYLKLILHFWKKKIFITVRRIKRRIFK